MKKVNKILPTGIKITQELRNGVVQINVGPEAKPLFRVKRPRFEEEELKYRIAALAGDEEIRIKNLSLN